MHESACAKVRMKLMKLVNHLHVPNSYMITSEGYDMGTFSLHQQPNIKPQFP